MKTIPAEKLNMVQALCFLHGLSQKQIVRITGLHYKQVESHIAKINKQIESGEISADDVLATAESTNVRLGLEELVKKDGGKEKIGPRKMPDIIGSDGKKIHPIMVSDASYNKMVEDVKETMNYAPDHRVAVGKNMFPFNDKKEANGPIPDNFQYPVTSNSTPYPVVVLNDIIRRIKNGSIVVTCLSISEEDFSTLSLNWRRKNESK